MSETQQEDPGVVVVGAGMAGVQTAVALREQGYEGPVTLLGTGWGCRPCRRRRRCGPCSPRRCGRGRR
ncbi:hypothetical protein ACWEO9_29900 [Streptomyces albidoflavus]